MVPRPSCSLICSFSCLRPIYSFSLSAISCSSAFCSFLSFSSSASFSLISSPILVLSAPTALSFDILRLLISPSRPVISSLLLATSSFFGCNSSCSSVLFWLRASSEASIAFLAFSGRFSTAF